MYDGAYILVLGVFWFFPDGSVGKESAYNTGDLGLMPGLGRSPGGGHSNILAWRTLMDRGAWPATVDEVAKSWT